MYLKIEDRPEQLHLILDHDDDLRSRIDETLRRHPVAEERSHLTLVFESIHELDAVGTADARVEALRGIVRVPDDEKLFLKKLGGYLGLRNVIVM